MTLDEALEKAARAICADGGVDPDEMLQWGPYVGDSLIRTNPAKERWKCTVDKLNLRQYFIAMEAAQVCFMWTDVRNI